MRQVMVGIHFLLVLLPGLSLPIFSSSSHASGTPATSRTIAVFDVGTQETDCETLLNNGEDKLLQAYYVEAQVDLEAALSCYKEADDQPGIGQALISYGELSYYQGKYEEAVDYYKQALIICREVGDRVGEGRTLNNIGLVYDGQGRFEEALDYYHQALAIHREVGNRRDEATTLQNIGYIHDQQGRYQEALDYYVQALLITREVGDRVGEGITLNNIGLGHHEQGRYEEALAYFQQALAIHREVDNRAGEGVTLNNIGLIYDAQARFEEALNYYQQALAIHREVGNRFAEATALHNIGYIHYQRGRYQEALDFYEQALPIRREVGDRAGEGITFTHIGFVYATQEQYEEALDYSEQALAIHREIGTRLWEGRTLNNIGVVYDGQGRYEEALEYYQQSLTIIREVGHREDEGITLNNIGIMFHRQKRYEEAWEHYVLAMDSLEMVRATAGSEQGRSSFAAQHASLYHAAVEVALHLDQAEDAFFVAERGRARAFLDSLATGQLELSDAPAQALFEQEQQLYQQREELQDRLAEARAQSTMDEQLVNELQAELEGVEAAYEAVVQDIEARDDALQSLIPGRGLDYVLEVSDVQAHLDKESTLVSYYLYSTDDDEEKAIAFVITNNTFETVPLPVGQSELTGALTDFRAFATLANPHPTSLQQFHQWLIEPLQAYLTTPRLIIIPHDVLHYLPFAALTDGEQYLGQQVILSILPSASILPLLPESKSTGDAALILGNPATQADLPNLPGAATEAATIANVYGTEPYLSEKASETLLRSLVSDSNILHIAAHAEFNPVSPLQSRLYLAPDEANDGQLQVDEVYSLDLENTELVILSACNTQMGEVNAGDDLVALNRAFLFAGAPSIIATLWPVLDESTALLMADFHEYLAQGWGAGEALQQAQLDLRTNHPEYAHPYYWAGFVLTGDGGPITQRTGVRQDQVVVDQTAEPDKAAKEPQEPNRTADNRGAIQQLGLGALSLLLVGLFTGLFLKRRRSRFKKIGS